MRPDEDDYVGSEQLTLADEDERLPWLESGDEEYEEGGVDTGRIFGFALLALLALAVIVGGIWWFGNRGPDPELVADGSTIEAPDGPYKQRPADPGGKKFEGTGNLAPVVGEGQSREGRIADTSPRPSIDVAKPTEDATDAAATTASSEPPVSSGGVAVQVGAYSTKASAEAGWQKLRGQTEHLNGVSHRVVEGDADIGTVYRLQAVAGDVASASRLCSALKGDGVACQVKR
ncbi:SPOR domain-containing protein [Tsuneonella amylolytica]|uniref:SPOR domain-containing protein n=1 Tax=Tsuneonella amylolytica TaxID=2338327 RepID=UPI000EA9A8D0|nr:SPOR domain-containing protein [Tsuneonella amylolytica]